MLTDKIIHELHIDWSKVAKDSYLRTIPSIQNLTRLEFPKNITFFVGENGSGKSTLLQAIAVAYGFNPEGGTINYSFSTYEDVSELYHALTLTKGIQRQKFGYFFRAESFLSFVEEYNGKGLYIMDEPEAALSPQRQLSLLIHIAKMAEAGSQFIIVTHSPILLGIPDADIISFDDGHIHRCTYVETESYQVTKMFLMHRKRCWKDVGGVVAYMVVWTLGVEN